ncbi:YbgA family protein [Enterococcus gilvus]|uniref:YbgA family protein n=1 Tax=Enterococcus gilvus TaxID=160453 RepID=UPI00345E06AD
MQDIQKEWAQWKYFVMARSQKEYLALRQLFSGNHWSEEKTEEFYQHLERVKKMPVDLKAQRNAYEHVWGYFKKTATPEERAQFFLLLEQMTETEDHALPYLKKLAETYQSTYLLDGHLFD